MTSEAVGSGLKRESGARASPTATPAHASPRMSLHVAAPRRSRLGRISEIQVVAPAGEGSPGVCVFVASLAAPRVLHLQPLSLPR